MVKLLLDRGANVNRRDKDGYSALTAAAESNVSVGTVRYLLNAGAHRKLKTGRGERPYDIAMRYHNRARRVIKTLNTLDRHRRVGAPRWKCA